MNTLAGHRDRLRSRFKSNPRQLEETELLELLLTYAIPRKDVTVLAKDLLIHFGSLHAVIAAPSEKLIEFPGLGEATATFIQLIQVITANTPDTQTEMSPTKHSTPSPQLNLFETQPEIQKAKSASYTVKTRTEVKTRRMRVFANDDIINSLTFLPQVTNFQSLEDFKRFLQEKLPYNAAETRQRRADSIINRFFPENDLDTPLSYFVSHCSAQVDLKPVVFYHILKAEPIAAKVAEEFIWPALPTGRVEREQMREFIFRYLPDASDSSMNNMLRALFYTYDLLGVGSTQDTSLRFQLHKATLESFLYVLTSEYPKPGIYSFDTLFNGPIHRWMLWDREWLRNQLYNLQDFGVLSKISEIDMVRQFSLAVDQPTALQQFFEHPERRNKAVRENKPGQNPGQEE
jgi:hypothetical protein